MSPTRQPSWVAGILWALFGLFVLRVVGQILVEFAGVTFLPPSEEWFSGVMPYAPLLISQIVVIILMMKICFDHSRQSGWTFAPGRQFGSIMLVGGWACIQCLRWYSPSGLYSESTH